MPERSVSLQVFKFSLEALAVIVVISIFTLVFFLYFIFAAPAYVWVTFPVVLFFIYAKYTGKAPYKTRIIDENNLIFSTDGIHYGENYYPVNEIEAAAIYLYAFENFEYRDGFVSSGGTQTVYACAPGDKNKISFRYQGEVSDFDFYIENFAQFCTIQYVLNDWIAAGVNVVLKQAFDNEFMLQEMNYYNTPTGFDLSK